MKSRLACSLPALEPEELKVTVEAWFEILNGAVPVARLNDAYVRAMRSRGNNFAMSAPEIVAAWVELSAENRHSNRPADLNRQLQGDVCPDCNGTGTELINEGGYPTARRCRHIG